MRHGRLFDNFGNQVQAVFDGGGDGLEGLAAVASVTSSARRRWVASRGLAMGSTSLVSTACNWSTMLQDFGDALGDLADLVVGDADARQLRNLFNFVLLNSHDV